ncbi:MAG: hypothetical protein AAF268_12070, partial [Cyanobacteria bacterium P01_A01_bin.3]
MTQALPSSPSTSVLSPQGDRSSDSAESVRRGRLAEAPSSSEERKTGQYSLRMADIPAGDRPRERLLARGARHLSSA